DPLVIGIAYPVDLRSTPARYVPMSATSDETVADEVSVNVAPLATSLTGTGTTTLGSATAAALAPTAVWTKPANPTSSPVPTTPITRTMRFMVGPFSSRGAGSRTPRPVPDSRSARDDVDLRHVPPGDADHRGSALQVRRLPRDRDGL